MADLLTIAAEHQLCSNCHLEARDCNLLIARERNYENRGCVSNCTVVRIKEILDRRKITRNTNSLIVLMDSGECRGNHFVGLLGGL